MGLGDLYTVILPACVLLLLLLEWPDRLESNQRPTA